MHNNMQLRIHSYGQNPDYHATFEYFRDNDWSDLTNRIAVRNTGGSEFPISTNKAYKQIYTASLTLDNTDGLLTPENRSSAYNLNGVGAYDPLLDEARKVRLKQGIYCYGSLLSGASISASPSPSGGTLSKLLDATESTYSRPGLGSIYDVAPDYADTVDKSDAELVYWSSVASGGTVTLTIDMGSSKYLRHGVLQFISKTNANPQIELPLNVQFAYSADNSTYYNIGAAFDMSEYIDSRAGQKYIAWFADANVNARYVKATITNISEENEIYCDLFNLWGGNTKTFQGEYTITGYLGDSIDMYASTGYITVEFEDVCKKESDNRRVELTLEYKNQRPEQIIYDLLTNSSYWSTGTRSGTELITNGGFESGTTGWTIAGGASRKNTNARTGTYCVEMDWDGEYVRQSGISVTAGESYYLDIWYYSPPVAAAGWHVELAFNVGGTQRYPDASYFEYFSKGYQRKTIKFTAPVGASSVALKIYKDTGGDGDWRIDDISIQRVAAEASIPYDSPLTNDEIGWAYEDNLSDFIIPKWQGQQGTIYDYCMELAGLVGWVYDADGTGIRQFWRPPESNVFADQYMAFWEGRQIGNEPIQRNKTGKDIRNAITIVGYEKNNKEVSRRYRHEASIARYGERYGRINEPLVKSATVSDQLAKAILRDFAYARDNVDAMVIGDFDIDRTKYICTFHEPIRAHIDKSELWSVEGVDTEMVTSGDGRYRTLLSCRAFVSAIPTTVANVAGTGGSGQITASWTASAEIDNDGYYVYWSALPNGTFTKRNKVTTNSDAITGLSGGTAYWFYVTAVNIAGVESEPSALVRCVASNGQSGTEASTWGIADLSVALTEGDANTVIDLSWTPVLAYNPTYISVTILGPESNNTPTFVSNTCQASPANGVLQHLYANYVTLAYPPGYTYYWRLAIDEVVIGNNHYKFGTPLYSNADSAVWPS